MQISVHADMKSTKRGIFQQTKNNTVVNKSVLDSCCKRSGDTAIPKNFNLKPATRKKNSFQYSWQLYPSIQWSKREAVASFLHLCLNNIWAPGQRHVCISKNSSFLKSSQAGIRVQARAGPLMGKCNSRFH